VENTNLLNSFLITESMAKPRLTKLGILFAKKSVNQASISRRTGISKQRLTTLATQSTERIRAIEICQLALAMEEEPGDLLDLLCNHVQVKEDTKADGRKNRKKTPG
jgi:DNA-binding Xre family transcriptional regulator